MTNIPVLVSRINEATHNKMYEWVKERGGLVAIILPTDKDFDTPLRVYFSPDEYTPGLVRRGDGVLSSRKFNKTDSTRLEPYLSDKVNYRNFWQLKYFVDQVVYKGEKLRKANFSQLPNDVVKKLALALRLMIKDFLKNKAKKGTILSWDSIDSTSDMWFFKNVLIKMDGYERGRIEGQFRFLIPKNLVRKTPNLA